MREEKAADWPMPPLLPGPWLDLDSAERMAVIAALIAADGAAGRGASPIEQLLGDPDEIRPLTARHEFGPIRARPLRFLPGSLLVEVLVALDAPEAGILRAVVGPKTRLLNGENIPMVELARAVPPKLDDAADALHFLAYFCGNLQSYDGSFRLLLGPEDVTWQPDATSAQRDALHDRLKAPVLVKGAEPEIAWTATAQLLHRGMLSEARFSISPAGEVTMEDDHLVLPEKAEDPPLPVLIERAEDCVWRLGPPPPPFSWPDDETES